MGYAFDFSAVFDKDVYLRFYQNLLDEEASEKEVDEILLRTTRRPGKRILDVACGFGRHSNLLAGKGFRVTGVDTNPEFLKMARERASKEDVSPEYIEMDMRELPFEKEFDMALSLFTSFGYFPDAENEKVLDGISRALVPGGAFVLDIVNRDGLLSRGGHGTFVARNGEDMMITEDSYNPREDRLESRRTCLIGKDRREMSMTLRLFSLKEITLRLKQYALVVYDVRGSFRGDPFTLTSPRCILYCRKGSAGGGISEAWVPAFLPL
ncbi:class I SAM-dependent methyltransferase [Candidatus Mcinerneyibacteriota bacterium]|nr:class I SAM-dependent methyltransferase [Candidatus Mcinerneyibacteriota bacterium]